MRSLRGTQASWDMGLGWPAALNISCRRRPFTLPRIARSRAYRPAEINDSILEKARTAAGQATYTLPGVKQFALLEAKTKALPRQVQAWVPSFDPEPSRLRRFTM